MGGKQIQLAAIEDLMQRIDVVLRTIKQQQPSQIAHAEDGELRNFAVPCALQRPHDKAVDGTSEDQPWTTKPAPHQIKDEVDGTEHKTKVEAQAPAEYFEIN